MTERQILLLYDAEQRRLSHHRANQVIDTNLAFAGATSSRNTSRRFGPSSGRFFACHKDPFARARNHTSHSFLT